MEMDDMQPEPEPELEQPTPKWANDESLGFLPRTAVEITSHVVGRGSHGIVYKGRLQMRDGIQDVAIKQLAPGATEREARQFVKEFKIALTASQKCMGACTMYGCVLNKQGALCLVMKLYKGSLNEYLDAQRDPRDDSRRLALSHVQVAAFGSQMATILAGLHANKIVVQDLKPSNVLLDEQDNLVIADYGLAVLVERSITSSMISQSRTTGDGAGTIDYMAPEQREYRTSGVLYHWARCARCFRFDLPQL